MNINATQIAVHKTATEKGWWEKPRPVPECLCLIHSEISEALEEYRKGYAAVTYNGEGNKPEGMPVELADAVIRIMDLCEYLSIDLAAAIKAKMAYNETRPYRHGGKIA